MRGIRGAICCRENTKVSIRRATQRLLSEICERNGLVTDQVVAAFFTTTPDLDAEFPAAAAREIGWDDVPMLGAQESQVPGALRRVIRVLVLARGEGPRRSVYLGRAVAMRPDLAEPGDERAWDDVEQGERATAAGDLGQLLIVGLGLIGGSLGAAAKASGRFSRVLGHDRAHERTMQARQLGLIDEGVIDLQASLGRADMVALAVPVDEIVHLVSRLGHAIGPGVLLTDVGSAKRDVAAAMDALPAGVRAVAGHPLAGKTESGPEAASASLFRDASWALVSTARTDGTARDLAERLVRAVQGRPVWMSAAAHDRAVASSSHLPVLAAVALVRSLSAGRGARPEEPLLLGPGFRSASRLADGDPGMTTQMLVANADEVVVAVARYIEELERVQAMLGDRDALAKLLGAARAERDHLLGGSWR